MRRLWLAFCVLACVACACLAVVHVDNIRRGWRSTGMVLDRVNRQTVASAMALYPDIPYAAYDETQRQEITAEAFPERKVNASVLRFTGRAEVIAPFRVAQGCLPMDDIGDACALDPATAHALWGSVDVLGQRLRCEGASYTVVGVIDTQERLLLMPAQRDELPTQLSIRAQDGYAKMAEIAGALGIELDGRTCVDGEAVGWLRLFVLSPLFIAALCAAGHARLRIGIERNRWMRRLPGLCMAAWILLALYLVLLHVPQRYLPNRWSDFGFYPSLIHSLKTSPHSLPGVRDLMFESDGRVALALTGAACLGCVWFFRAWTMKKRSE